jgi:DNA processing protein
MWLALRRAGLGSTNFALLLKAFGNIEAAWAATSDDIGRAGIDPQFVRAFQKARNAYDPDAELRALDEHGVRAYTWLDEDFPASLREIPQSPPVIFARGSVGPHCDPAVAVVGTRRVTPYGRQVAEHFTGAMARAGVCIVSGLARGVDAIAHRVALEEGAPTIAVLAGGIDRIFPTENRGLAERIAEHGCLVSEYPLGIPPRPDYFPRRNRILSGLARATLVVEAGQGSGALHTANWAFEQRRDVFSVPGSVFSRQSEGTNQLIRESTAKLVATPEQLLEEINLLSANGQIPLVRETKEAMKAPVPASQDEGKILHWLQEGPAHVDEIVRASGLPVSFVSSTLQLLELKGMVRQEMPLVYARAQ